MPSIKVLDRKKTEERTIEFIKELVTFDKKWSAYYYSHISPADMNEYGLVSSPEDWNKVKDQINASGIGTIKDVPTSEGYNQVIGITISHN